MQWEEHDWKCMTWVLEWELLNKPKLRSTIQNKWLVIFKRVNQENQEKKLRMCSSFLCKRLKIHEITMYNFFFTFLKIYLFFPTVQQGDQVILTCIHFSPPFVLLQYEYLDIVLDNV